MYYNDLWSTRVYKKKKNNSVLSFASSPHDLITPASTYLLVAQLFMLQSRCIRQGFYF